MSTETNKEIVRRIYEHGNAKDLRATFAAFDPDFVDHGLDQQSPSMPRGIEGSRQFFNMLFSAFPDMHATPEDIIAEGDKVVARSSAQGTHSGVFMGIPPTGKQVKFTFMDIYRIENGKIVEHWGMTDNMGVLQQLGVIPPSRNR